MQNRRSNSVAVPERRRFMPAGHIFLFGLIVAGTLMAVFPGERLQRRLDSSAFSDPLSIAYLEAWLRARPEDDRLRLVLVRRQAVEGALARAGRTLAPLLGSGASAGYYRNEAESLQLDLLMQALHKQVPGGVAYDRARRAVLQQLERMAGLRWEPAPLEHFAHTAIALDAPDHALLFLRHLLETEPYEGVHIRSDIAALQLAQGHYREAAATHFLAMDHAYSRDEKRQQFMAGLAALQSGNLLDEAMAAADARWELLADDPDTLEFLARLARSANRLDRAEFYVSRLLRQRVGGQG
jgi:polysaccharide biosynthesis protein PelB